MQRGIGRAEGPVVSPERSVGDRSRPRIDCLRAWYYRRLVMPARARYGRLSRRLQWRLPWKAPYLRGELVLARKGALGDVLMCTPILRRIKELNPDCTLTFYTGLRDLVEGLPYIDEVRDWRDGVPPEAIHLSYEGVPDPRRHIAGIMADAVGLHVPDVRPDCNLDRELARECEATWATLPRPHIVVNRFASAWTPNKEWPADYWDDLVARLTARAGVIEIGSVPSGTATPPLSNYVNLAGKTSLERMVALLATSDLHVGPISGPVHVAAAFRVPCVVIYGGYEDPSCSGYAGNMNLATKPPCAPCWLREPCPFDKKCLREITPATVERAVDRLWSRASRRPDERSLRVMNNAV